MALKYSKEVEENFMNPKNLGEMKNPSGVGKIGNPACLPPIEKISLNGEFIEIINSKKKDLVISHDATTNKIVSIHSRKYNGNLLKLKNSLGEISLTPEHLIYSISVPKKSKFKRSKGKKTLIPAWYHAEQLKKGDISLYPFSKKEKEIKDLKIDILKPKYDFRSKNLPKKVPLNSKLLRLFGYFISEGNIQDHPCKTYISFALHIKEKDIVEDIQDISKELFGLEIKIKERPKNNGVIVYIYNAQLARWFKKLFGNGAGKKKFPNFLMKIPIKKQKSLIEGFWKGDGCINVNRKGPRGGYVTISHQLSQQIKVLLLRQGIIPSMYFEDEKKSKWANHKKAYRIHVGQRDSLKKLCLILKKKYSPKSYPVVSSWIEGNILYTPITKIEKIPYHGQVHNLEIEKTHSYISEAFTLHNCGDIMHLYIKVKDDIITDIKFKTFGCAAAIATSSMITQLAKGKSIKEAKKLETAKIAKSLKGLPPIKVHCASMAAKALKLAIEDYEKKKIKPKSI